MIVDQGLNPPLREDPVIVSSKPKNVFIICFVLDCVCCRFGDDGGSGGDNVDPLSRCLIFYLFGVEFSKDLSYLIIDKMLPKMFLLFPFDPQCTFKYVNKWCGLIYYGEQQL